MTEQPATRKGRWLCLLLAATTLAVFWPVTGHDFINFDDPDYVTSNPVVQQGLTWEGFRWAFTSAHACNWHPLTWLSHMLDVQLFGLKPGWHHLTNLLFHTANTLLLFVVFRRMTGAFWRSGFVAALFALHPLHVESVAWVAERKDVLSTFFWMLTLWAYSRYAEFRVSGFKIQGGARKWYGLGLLFFALGLMSKPMLVTLPFVLLLLDYWPLRRFQFTTFSSLRSVSSRLVIEKLPFFVLTLAASTVTFLVQRYGGAVASLQHTSLDARIENMFVAYAGYILKTLWPSGLAVLYLRPKAWPPGQTALSVLLLVAVSILVFWQARRRQYLVVGWLWFLGTLVPVIGLIQVGNQSMADRYTYVPLIGLFIVLAWAGGEAAARWRLPASVTTAILLAAIAGCAALAQVQLSYWRNSQTLFAHAIKVTEENFVAHNNLGYDFATQGKLEKAKVHYVESLRIKPNYAEAMLNMGVLLTQQGKTEEAKSYLNEAIRVRPQFAEVHAKLAFALSAEGRFSEAVGSYREAVRLKPIFSEAMNNLAWILASNPNDKIRNGSEAVQWAMRACELTHNEVPIMVGTLAAAYAEAGRFSDAIITAQKARALALAKGQQELARKNLELLELYRSGQPYREPPFSTDAAKPRT